VWICEKLPNSFSRHQHLNSASGEKSTANACWLWMIEDVLPIHNPVSSVPLQMSAKLN